MPLPVGVITKTVTIAVPMDVLGDSAKAFTGTVKPDRPLVWAATGDLIWPVPSRLPAPVDGLITIDVPPVDQAGMLDANGAPITNWSYRVTVNGTWSSALRTRTRSFQVFTADASPVELDILLDSGGLVPPVVEPNPYVQSVAGHSAIVTEAQIAAAVGNRLAAADAGILDPVNERINDIALPAIDTAVQPYADVTPNGIIEGRALFQYGPSRGVGVTAQRIHFNRLRRRLGSGFWFNGSVAGHQAADTATVMYGTRSTTRQANGENEWAPTSGVSTWANKVNQGGVLIVWPFGNDALHDGRPDRNSTPAKARAGAKNALHAIVAMARAETRIESVLQGAYTTVSGSPDITGAAGNPWYKGMLVQGAGIPANTYVGDMINGGAGGFKLSSSRTAQVNVNATASASNVTLTFSPTFSGAWTTRVSTEFSGGNMVSTNASGATKTYVVHIPAGAARRVHWVTAGVDDAEYAGTKAAPYGGTGGATYSIAVDGGAPITGTTADEHRFGALDNCFSQKVVTLGPLAAGAHTIEITCTAASKLLVDDGLLVDSLTPPTVLIMKEVELPAAYYALLPTYGASYAKTQTYNGFIDLEVAAWPADESVITMDITDHGYDKALHVSAADGAYAHFNDAGERLAANAILARLNELPARVGLVWT